MPVVDSTTPLPPFESRPPSRSPARHLYPVQAFFSLIVVLGVGCHKSTVKTTVDAAPTFDGSVGEALDGASMASLSDGATAKEADGRNADARFDAAVERWAGADAGGERSPDSRVAPDALVVYDPSVVNTPTGEVGLAVWGSGPKDIWTGGMGGSLRHWNGTNWTDYPFFPSTCLVLAILGTSPSSVWAAGCTNTVAFWDGISWKEQPTPAGSRVLIAMQGTAADDIWIGGCRNLLMHWDGRNWNEMDSGTPNCIQGFWFNHRSDGWLVTDGFPSMVSHWDGQKWNTTIISGVGSIQPLAIFAKSVDDVWVGSYIGLYHFDGTNWGIPPVEKDLGTTRPTVFALWGRAANDLYAGSLVMWHYDGASWSPIGGLKEGSVRGIWGEPVGETWFVGDNGFLGRLP